MKKIFTWLRRYVTLPLVIGLAYVLFVLFFNENSYFKSLDYQKQIDQLEAEIKENRDTMLHYHILNSRLDTDAATLERIVREQYHMQHPNEDVYVFVEE